MSLRAKISTGGKIAIPSVFRKQLNLKDGEEILIDLQDGNIIISSLQMTLAKVRKNIDKYQGENDSLVDKLLEIRKEEASHE